MTKVFTHPLSSDTLVHEFEFSSKKFRNVVHTWREESLVGFGEDEGTARLYLYSRSAGLTQVEIQYPGYKEVNRVVSVPDTIDTIALVDADKVRRSNWMHNSSSLT